MKKLIAGSFEELEKSIGQEMGPSEWMSVTQEQINLFADATHDHQWIHVDVERAKKESPHGKTIAHGYLTVSLIPTHLFQVLVVENSSMIVNYGIDSLRFVQPVVVDSRVRLKGKVSSVKNLRGTTKVILNVEIEIEGEKKPALSGDVVLLYFFE